MARVCALALLLLGNGCTLLGRVEGLDGRTAHVVRATSGAGEAFRHTLELQDVTEMEQAEGLPGATVGALVGLAVDLGLLVVLTLLLEDLRSAELGPKHWDDSSFERSM